MLRYRLEGNGPPLLLIHGWGVTYTVWQKLLPLLKPHFQIIMIELPGNGGSPDVDSDIPYYPACAETIDEVRQHLGIEQWSILAYSSGTRAAEAYIQRYPQQVTRVVFLCPIYLTELCSLALRVLDNTRPRPTFEPLTQWLFSDWRLYGLILALGFNGKRHDYTNLWKNEIELQSMENLLRMLCELPGKGRAPFELPAVPTLFVWGSHDTLTARPRHPRPNDIFIPANHSAPMLAAPSVAEAVLPFLQEGRYLSLHRRMRWLYRRRYQSDDLAKEPRVLQRALPLRRLARKSVVREIESTGNR
ncbi:MAG TPA: alpha/beta hydrolase [Ktedonobacteraceae bacterium]|jgi:pimeloyl-ACP methyl ester carboxylesterase|nr:alpha/beta hydrolase [Ktedonobacteraceae bacterium]